MEIPEEHLRHIMLYEYKKYNNATIATENICQVYGNVLDVRKCQRWFQRFRSGVECLKDLEGRGRNSTFDDDELKRLVESDPRQSIRDIAKNIKCSIDTIRRQLHQIGKVWKCGIWVPHQLSVSNLNQRMSIATSLLSRQKFEPFLDRVITGDEKWVLYVNVRNNKQWLDPAQTPVVTVKNMNYNKKIMLSIWWDIRGIIHYELMNPNQTINSEIYCQQLTRLHQELVKKRPSLVNRKQIVFHHDNAKPHISKVTQQKIIELGWELLPHPPYSPDLAPTDYHLFRSMQSFFNGKTFVKKVDLEQELIKFFESKEEAFYRRGIEQLVERWQKVIDNNGSYFI